MSPVAVLRAGVGFGALGFVIGGLLGPLREALLAPRIGGLAAAWAEAAVMAPLLWFGAGLILAEAGGSGAGTGRGFWPPSALPPPMPARIGTGARLAIGLIALLVVLAAEAALAALFAATGLAGRRAPRQLAELLPGWLLLGWLLLLPLLRRRG